MSDKITLPGQIQHSNPSFSIIDINDVRGGIKSVDTFDNPSLQNLLSTGIDKFLIDHTIILERSSNSFFWLSGSTPSDVGSWNSISIEQDNKFRYIKTNFMIGGKGIQLSEHESIIQNRIQSYFNNNIFTVTDIELVIFIFTIQEYGLFLSHDRKYTFPNMLGKGTYGILNNNVIQYDDIELIYKSTSVTNLNLEGSVNNVVTDLGDIGESGSPLSTLNNYLNAYGVYDLEDTTKIYYFKFILGGIEYIYYFEGIDSVNGYVIYGFGLSEFSETDFTLFYSSDMPLVMGDFNQDNRFKFIDYNITLKGKKDTPTIFNTTELLSEKVNTIFATNSINISDTELIIFKFNIVDTRINGVYSWKYSSVLGKGNYSPILDNISFEDLEVTFQDFNYKPGTIIDIEQDTGNFIYTLTILGSLITMDDLNDSISADVLSNYFSDTDQTLDMSDPSKIYFFRFELNDIELLYYYSGNTLGIFGSEQLNFNDGDVLFFYKSSGSTESNSINNNIPRTYKISSTDIDKPLLNITEHDIANYVNNLPGYIHVDEYDSMLIFDIYQPQIDINFGNITLSTVSDIYSHYSWNEWINRSTEYSNHAITFDNSKFEFSDISVKNNTISLIGDLNDLYSFSLSSVSYTGYTFSRVLFDKSKIKKVSIFSDVPVVVDISNLYELSSLSLDVEISRLDIKSKYVDTLYIGNSIAEFNFTTQATMSVTASYYFASGVVQEADIMSMLNNLVQSPISNIGYFAIEDYIYLNDVVTSPEIVILTNRGWIFYDPLVVILPPPPSTTLPDS